MSARLRCGWERGCASPRSIAAAAARPARAAPAQTLPRRAALTAALSLLCVRPRLRPRTPCSCSSRAMPVLAVQGVATDEATMSDISLSEGAPAAAVPAPARPPLPTEPPPFSAAAAAPPAEAAAAAAAAAAPSAPRELTAEQRADLAQLSQKVRSPWRTRERASNRQRRGAGASALLSAVWV